MKKVMFAIILTITALNLSAHEGGHGTLSREWKIEAYENSIKADFIKYEKGEVWLMHKDHNLKAYSLSAFAAEDQAYINSINEAIHSLNSGEASKAGSSSFLFANITILILGGLILIISIYFLGKKRKLIHLSYGLLGFGVIIFISCKKNIITKTDALEVPQNDASVMQTYFEKFSRVSTNSDEDYFYVSSNGIPEHEMMVGITNWQQQVPVNQNYTANNSWAIPLQPKMAEQPLSTKTNLLKGAIAVAVNGIPIFNPLNNRGEDANAIGELDKWGGHCGRADDYHYHLPPLHLQEQVGEGNPVAYAVDGFPVYGETTELLDENLGKLNPDGSYQYHSIKEYPYLIAAMRGEVTLDPNSQAPENQVIPQPRTQEIRPALSPLRGAEIIDFKSLASNSYSLTYRLNAKDYKINYKWDSSNNYTYEFIDPYGTSTIQTYKR